MNNAQMKFFGVGIFFLFIFLSGFWLSRSGKPYSTLIFTIYKLIGLAAGAFLVMTVYRVYKIEAFHPDQIVAVSITVVLFILTIVAGGLLSIEKPMPLVITIMHRALPYLTALSTGGTLYLLLI